jgi:hypothetical protein
MNGVERFHKFLNHATDRRLSKQEAADAFQNLTGFMSLLVKINEREKVAQDD